MPNIKSAKKALRRAKKRALKNTQIRTVYKTAVKDIRKSIERGEKDLSEKLRLAQKRLDKATKRGIIKPNTASRKLSRLMKKINKVKKSNQIE